MESTSASTTTAATDPRWAMLNWIVRRRDESIVPDAKTVAECRTSDFGGGQLLVSFSLAPPPESSFLYYDWTGAELDPRHRQFRVMAAHGDSVLFESYYTHYFVYRAGGTATRRPSLSQLPARDVPTVGERLRGVVRQKPSDRMLLKKDTGLLRRGEDDELLVAQLELTQSSVDSFLAEVCVLHVGRSEWELKPAAPIVYDGERDDNSADKGDRPWWSLLSSLIGDKVLPVGDRFLCLVDYGQGFVLVCDMAEKSPSKVRYVPLPVVPLLWADYYEDGRRPVIEHSRDICGVGVGALKFVSIDLRCCCCARSSNAFLVTTWTLALRTDDGPMAWVERGALGAAGYDGLPRVHPTCPVVSLDNPDVVCFCVAWMEFDSLDQRKVWMVEVDMRKKALLSVVCCSHRGYGPHYISPHLPVKLQY